MHTSCIDKGRGTIRLQISRPVRDAVVFAAAERMETGDWGLTAWAMRAGVSGQAVRHAIPIPATISARTDVEAASHAMAHAVRHLEEDDLDLWSA